MHERTLSAALITAVTCAPAASRAVALRDRDLRGVSEARQVLASALHRPEHPAIAHAPCRFAAQCRHGPRRHTTRPRSQPQRRNDGQSGRRPRRDRMGTNRPGNAHHPRTTRDALADGPAAMCRVLPGGRGGLTFILPNPNLRLILPADNGLEPGLWYHDEPSWLSRALVPFGQASLTRLVSS